MHARTLLKQSTQLGRVRLSWACLLTNLGMHLLRINC